MGSSRWDASDWGAYSTSTIGKSTADIYKTSAHTVAASGLPKELDPKGVKLRESRDSTVNPAATPLLFGLDVTGSMGMIADNIARNGLGVLFKEVLDRKPVTDPHVAFAAFGDAFFDRAPFQISQYEADTKTIIDQLTKIFLEKGGGGNSSESVHLTWYFAAQHTAHDSIEKRGKKGYLFTASDEEVPPALTKEQIKKIFGDEVQQDYSTAELLEMAGQSYHVFHLMVAEGSHMQRSGRTRVEQQWKDLMGQRAILLDDHTKLAEVVVSLMQVIEGEDKDKVVKSWSGSTAVTVGKAVRDLVVPAKGSGIVRL